MGDYMEKIADEAYSRLISGPFKDVYIQIQNSKDPDNLRKVLDKYLKQIPVVGFNSGNYDINMVKPYMIKKFVLPYPTSHTIKRGNDFLSISTPKFNFLDITNFIAPGYNLSKYLASYKIKEKKGFFAYEYLDSLDKLKETKLPPKEAFYSKLKDQHISDADYEVCQKAWADENMKTMYDFLVWYNNKDVVTLCKAVGEQSKIFSREFDLDLLKHGKSIPGLTLRYLFKNIPDDVYFSLIPEHHNDLHTLLREEMVGGPSIIFKRYIERNITRIRGGTKTAQRLVGLDANALYLWALSQDMPSEHFIRRQKKTGFKAEHVDKFGRMSREWLEWVAFRDGITIQHKFNGKEMVLGQQHKRVDGWDGKVAYEFHGCAFHGHECHLTKGKTHHPYNKKSFQTLREETEEKERYLKEEVGVRVEVMRECQWLELKKTTPQISAFIEDNDIGFKSTFNGVKPNKETIIQKVLSGDFFGLVQCDIHTPMALKEKFNEMTPIFKNTTISSSDIGDHMGEYCKTEGLLRQPRRALIGSYFGDQILLATPLLKWYLEQGLVVTDIQQIIEYKPVRCFNGFAEKVTAARREGDRNKDSSILADSYKLLGNSAYGKTLEDLSRHRHVKHVTDSTKLVNDPLFKKQSVLDTDLMEVEMGKKLVKWGLPNQIGFFVYQYAKLRMLDFYYNCLQYYIDPSDYEMCEMDTDSLYFGISGQSIESVVKPTRRESFYRNFHKWFPSPHCEVHHEEYVKVKCENLEWKQPDCCKQRQENDRRTPGLFKVEFEGDGCIALTSKTYFCFGADSVKLASKGLNIKLNKLTKERYMDVLKTRKAGSGINRGFRAIDNKILTYEQERAALPYLYIKRKVASDGISTSPLDI